MRQQPANYSLGGRGRRFKNEAADGRVLHDARGFERILYAGKLACERFEHKLPSPYRQRIPIG